MNSNHHLLRKARECAGTSRRGLSYVPRGWIKLSSGDLVSGPLSPLSPRSRTTSYPISPSPLSFQLTVSPLHPHLAVSLCCNPIHAATLVLLANRAPIARTSSPFPPICSHPNRIPPHAGKRSDRLYRQAVRQKKSTGCILQETET